MAKTLAETRQDSCELAEVLEELKAREPIFHRPEFGTSRVDFERMTEAKFWEIGASGRAYSREFVLDELEGRLVEPRSDVWETSNFRCQKLAEGLYLLSYTLLQDSVRRTRRTTLWRKTGEAWQIVFHQGTIVQEA